MKEARSSKSVRFTTSQWIEWLTGLVATLVILCMIAWLIFEAATSTDRPPELSAEVLAVDKMGSGWRVMIEVRNEGDQAAAAVDVQATLADEQGVVERAQVTFDYVAAGSSSRGGLIFQKDPSTLNLKVVPSGFTEP